MERNADGVNPDREGLGRSPSETAATDSVSLWAQT